MLLVAGGGSGGVSYGGGGGAGGVLSNVDVTSALTPGQSYSITVGFGGNASGSTGTSGGSSLALGYTATGGGAGGSASSVGSTGGSGGGGSAPPTGLNGGAGTTGQGTGGGYGGYRVWNAGPPIKSAKVAGGGGGATGNVGCDSAIVGISSYARVGTGGQGLYDDISGSVVYYGEGGIGSGSNEGYPSSDNNFSSNGAPSSTVGGGGGGLLGSSIDNSIAGGKSGICIIKYQYLARN
jgi:hypothetical protein